MHRALRARRVPGLAAAVALAFAVVFLALSTQARAQSLGFSCDGDLSDPCQFCGDQGDTLCVFVEVDGGVLDLQGASLVLGFDPTYITPISVEPWGLFAGSPCTGQAFWVNQASFVNTVEVDLAGLGCSTDGPGAILRICFTGAPPDIEGTSPFFCSSSILRNSANDPITHVCGTADITNVCPPVPVRPATWGELKSAFHTVTVRHP